MSKKQFIQAVFARTVPQPSKFKDGLQYAESLWAFLSQHGYGDSQAHQPKAGVDYYRKLSPAMKEQFDKFWMAFNYKEGKQGAAMRWWQMGELSRADCDNIIVAAEQTAAARKNLPEGRTPIMAQGWLNEMRFLDGAVSQTEQRQKAGHQQQAKLIQLNGDLAHAKKMADLSAPSGRQYWESEVEKIREKIRVARGQNNDVP